MGIIDDIWGIITGDKQFKIDKGEGTYYVIKLDLTEARDNKKLSFSGNRMIVQKIDSQAHVKLNSLKNPDIDLSVVPFIKTRFDRFYITNDAKKGTLELLCGTKGMFDAVLTDPSVYVDPSGHVHNISMDELAVRLGSVVTFDRSGSVDFFDDCESSTIKWQISINGVGAGVTVSTDTAVMGDSSLKLTAGAGAVGLATIMKYIHPKILGRLALEFSFTVDADTEYVKGNIGHWDGTTEHQSMITYDHQNSKLIYTTNSGDVDIATGVTLNDVADIFHVMKIVIDTSTNRPVRLLVNENVYDLSPYVPKQFAGGGSGEWIKLAITHWSDHANAKSIYVDNIIFTQKEP